MNTCTNRNVLQMLATLLLALSLPVLSPSGTSSTLAPEDSDGYVVVVSFSKNDAAPQTPVPVMHARRPTPAERYPAPGSNSNFFLYLRSTQRISFAPHTSIDVTFPQYLSPRVEFSIMLDLTETPVGPIVGSLHNNTLHFDLPAFTILPGTPVTAEIESRPPF